MRYQKQLLNLYDLSKIKILVFYIFRIGGITFLFCPNLEIGILLLLFFVYAVNVSDNFFLFTFSSGNQLVVVYND